MAGLGVLYLQVVAACYVMVSVALMHTVIIDSVASVDVYGFVHYGAAHTAIQKHWMNVLADQFCV